MKLSNRKIRALNQALHAIDGKKADGSDRPKNIPWKVVYAAARTIAALAPHVDAIDKAISAAVGQFSGGKAGVAQDDPNFMKATAAVAEILDEESEVEVHLVQIADLDSCGLAPAVVASLMPMIDDDA